MKKVFLFLLCIIYANASKIMSIHLKNGEIINYQLDNITKITYSNNISLKNYALITKGASTWDNGSFKYNGQLHSSTLSIDNDLNTFWCGIENKVPQTLIITLDKKRTVHKLKILEATSYIKKGRIFSFDGEKYKLVYVINKNQVNLTKKLKPFSTTRIKLIIDDFKAPNTWSNKTVCIKSFEIFAL